MILYLANLKKKKVSNEFIINDFVFSELEKEEVLKCLNLK